MTITQSSAAEFTAASISSIVKSQDGANTPLTDIRSSLAPVSGTPSRSTSSNPASACNSAHPSPNGTLTKPPSIDALTPRSVKLYDLEDHVASALRTSKNQEPSDSPFFAGWDASASKGAEPLSTSEQVSPQEDLFDVHEQKSYSLASAAG